MSLLKLKLIVLIDRYKQVTAVANALQIKQPTVSFHMKKMEEEWGVKLFEQRTGKVLLTPHGRMLLHYASQIDELYKEATMKLSMISETEKKRLVIGCTESTGEWLARTGALAKLGNVNDRVKLTISIHEHDELFKKLNNGLVDLALSGETLTHTEAVEWRHQRVHSSALVLMVPSGHHLLDQGPEGLSKLHDYEFNELTDPSIASCIRSWGRKDHHFFQPSAAFGSVPLLLQAVSANQALAIVPASLIPPESGLIELRLDGDTSIWNIHASWRHSYWDQALAAQVAEALSRV